MPDAHSEEEKRLKAVADLNLLDKPEEERFQRITRLVRRHFQASASSITLIDSNRAFYVARDGLVDRSGPRKASQCNRVVDNKDPLVIKDLSLEAQSDVYKNLVERLDLHFYAGVPILSPDGYAVGALCVMDHIPRRFSRRELESLVDFASIVEDEMQFKRTDVVNRELVSQVERLRFRAFVDPLTNVWNRGAIFDVLHRELERSRRSEQALSVCMLDLDRFKSVNDTYGHQAGDEVLQETCVRVRSAVRPYDSIGRYGGEEFLIVYPETNLKQATSQAERVRKAVGEREFQLPGGQSKTITVSLGVAELQADEDIKSVIARADAALYQAKNEGRNRVATA